MWCQPNAKGSTMGLLFILEGGQFLELSISWVFGQQLSTTVSSRLWPLCWVGRSLFARRSEAFWTWMPRYSIEKRKGPSFVFMRSFRSLAEIWEACFFVTYLAWIEENKMLALYSCAVLLVSYGINSRSTDSLPRHLVHMETYMVKWSTTARPKEIFRKSGYKSLKDPTGWENGVCCRYGELLLPARGARDREI